VALLGLLGLLACASGPADDAPTMAPNAQGAAMKVVPSSLTTGVERHTLSNGLTLLIKQNRSAPVAAVVTHVKTGYFHEPDELAGISHVIEHMFFNGTPSRPDPEAISRETKAHGGTLNAGTIYDRTSYYVVLPAERWREGLEIQADALQNPLFDEDVLSREMQAILQEARRKLDNPGAYGREKMFDLAFDHHRMQRWRIGTEDVLGSIDREELVRWYEDHYRPTNVVLTVVGDVDPAKVLSEVESLYGDMPRGHLRQHTGPDEPQQEEFRYRRLRGQLIRGYTFLGFHTPGENHPDNAALDVLATVLATGRSSRMQARLREDMGLVSTVNAASYQYDDVGMFEISATYDPEQTDWVGRELFVEVERMKLFGPTDEELDRARGILEAAEAFGQEEVLGQANMLAAYEAQGGYRLYDRELAELRSVWAEDVKRVANTYLTFDNASLLEYVTPEVIGERTAEEQREHLYGAVLAAVREMDVPDLPDQRPSLLPREQIESWAERLASSPADEGERSRFDLPGGGVLVVEENPDAPTVTAGMYFLGGRTNEFRNISGVTQLMQRLMVKQTQNRSVEQLAAEIESMGTQIRRVATDDWLGFAVASRSEDFAAAFDVLFDVVTRPNFLAEQYAKEFRQHRAAIQAVEDQSSAMAVQLMRAALFAEHPYGLPELGLANVLQYLDADRVDQHHYEVVRPETMVLSVAGNVDADLVFELVKTYAEEWRVTGRPSPNTIDGFYAAERIEQLPSLLSNRDVAMEKERAQTALLMAYPTVDRRHPDAPVLEVLSAITGGLGGTFFEEIRGRRGLAYQVSTFSATRTLGGFFGTFVACSPEEEHTVIELVADLHARLADEPPSAPELERAQNYLVGSYKVSAQTNAARSGRMAAALLGGFDLERIDTYEQRIRDVTREDLARVAREHFVDQPYALGIVRGTDGRGADPAESR